MPQMGNRSLNLHTVKPDETVYATAANTVSHTSIVTLRRTPPKSRTTPLRTNVRIEQGFNTAGAGALVEKEDPVVISIACTVPPGVAVADVKTFISDSLIQAATLVADTSVTGDIHLSA